jgi:hypothetical protein
VSSANVVVMPGGQTRFNSDWLSTIDCNGHALSEWCGADKTSDFSALCRLYNKEIRCDNQGLQQVLRHAEGDSHKQLAENIVSGKQLTLTAAKSSDKGAVSTSSTVYAVSKKDHATKAELIWAIKVVASGYSYASCDDIKDVFRAMFPDGVPDNFTISSSKVSYLVSDATGHKALKSDVLSALHHSDKACLCCTLTVSLN